MTKKKETIILIALSIFVGIFVLVGLGFGIWALTIKAGGNLKSSEKIEASNVFGDKLEIKIHVERYEFAGSICHFSIDKDSAELKSAIDGAERNGGTLKTEVFGEHLFLEKTNNAGERYYYYLTNTGKNETLYSYTFQDGYGRVKEGNKFYDAVIPWQIIKGIGVQEGMYWEAIDADTPYEITGTKKEFVDFYKNSVAYEVTGEGDIYTLHIKDKYVPQGYTKNDFRLVFDEGERATVEYRVVG